MTRHTCTITIDLDEEDPEKATSIIEKQLKPLDSDVDVSVDDSEDLDQEDDEPETPTKPG